ncbi:MAG: cyclic nucleotide-binding domain-containing protein [Actinomycetota bacterium]|nr:cyclic nucleotide-binding domain-containing protein [Actinomycetota bacterium]
MDASRLSAIPVFSQLSHRAREQVARWADEVDVASGKELTEQGRLAYEFFAIEEGTADVLQDGQRIATLGPGDFFGEIALLHGDRRTASVVASTPMTLIVMHARDFRHMAREMPEVAEQLEQAVRQRLGAAG